MFNARSANKFRKKTKAIKLQKQLAMNTVIQSPMTRRTEALVGAHQGFGEAYGVSLISGPISVCMDGGPRLGAALLTIAFSSLRTRGIA
jgi:hypothetical protein